MSTDCNPGPPAVTGGGPYVDTAVAVIMCVYERDNAEFLDRALRSIESQDYADGPVRIYFCIDGVVGQALQNVIDNHAEKMYRRIQNDANCGIARSLNRLLRLLEDEAYIVRMDADDYSYPHRISTQIRAMRDDPGIGIIGSSIQEVDKNGRVMRTVRYPRDHASIERFIVWRSPFAHPTVCFSRAAVQKFGQYPERANNEDIALWFQCMLLGIKMANLDEPLVRMTISDDFFKRRNYRKAVEEFRVWMAGIYATRGLSPYLVYPAMRFIFRLLPQRVAQVAYRSRLR